MSVKKDETKKRSELFKKLLDTEKKLSKCKCLYDLRDQICMELASLGLGEFFYEGQNFEVKDQFENSNVAYKACGVSRYVVKIKPQK
jgi:hypothetical protein